MSLTFFLIFSLNAQQKEWLTLKWRFSFKHTSLTSPSCPPTLAGTAGTCCWQWALGIFWWLCCSSSRVLLSAEAWPLHEPRRCLTPSGHKQRHWLVSPHFYSGILLLLRFLFFHLVLALNEEVQHILPDLIKVLINELVNLHCWDRRLILHEKEHSVTKDFLLNPL